jgi:tetratricopeptide (TPR) repeat protein
MSRIPNPYIAGPPVSGPNFYGREDIFRFVQNTFSSLYQNVIVLWGQRRMGKTSVLHELSSRLSPEFHPIFFDLQDKAQQKLNEVLYDLAREIAGSLNLDSPSSADFLRDDDYFHERFLPQVYQTLGAKRLLLMFDEFDVLDMPKKELAGDVAVRAFFPYLRRALMDDRQLAFVFVVGRRLDELDELLQSTFKMAKTASISFLEEAEARQLIVEPASGILEYDEEAVGQIISITACHPYLTQLVCSELFSYVEAAGRTRVTVSDAEAVVDEAIAAGSAGLTWLWGGLPTAERFVLSAVAYAAREGRVATEDEIGRILEEHNVPFLGPELTQAPDNLTRWGLLRPTADGYEFLVDLLQRWILREHSLEQARRELGLASSRAIELYEQAFKAHQAGERDRAIRDYRYALAANPNHPQARLGLAQALFEQGSIEEAIAEFEGAYALDRAKARDGLIKAREALADALEKEGRVSEADQEYETILRTAPRDHRVRKLVADRWTTRGRKYLREKSYEKAVADYGKADKLNVPGVREALIAARRAWAEALEREGKVNEADQQYETILRIAPDDKLKEWVAGCWMARGKKYLEGKRYEEGVAEYEKADKLNVLGVREALIAARRAWAEALEKEDKVGEADQQYEAILSIAPDDNKLKECVANCRIARGKKYLKGERYQEAVAEYEKAAELDVSGAQEGLIATRCTWAEALEREDRTGEADQQYETILSLASDDARVREWVADSLIRRGDRYREKGRYGEASKAYDRAEDIQPQKQQVVAQRRRWLELVPDYDRAMGAHQARDWATAEKEWAELYKKDRNYKRDGKTVAVLLAEAIEKREGISKHRQRRLILVSSGLAVVVAALILWLGWGSVVTSGQIGVGRLALVIRTPTPVTSPTPAPLPTEVPTTLTIVTDTATPRAAATGTPTSTPASTPTPTPIGTPMPTLPPTIIVATPTPGPSPTPIIIVATPTPGPSPTPIIIVATPTPGPPPTPIIIVATPTPGPPPTPILFSAPRLIGPENEQEFFGGKAAEIILQWEPVGPLAENECYQVVLIFFTLEGTQYMGTRLKETRWQVPPYFYGQANQPERIYYWHVTVIQVDKDPAGKETSIAQRPQSETWAFYWP